MAILLPTQKRRGLRNVGVGAVFMYHPQKKTRCFVKSDELVTLIKKHYGHKVKYVKYKSPDGSKVAHKTQGVKKDTFSFDHYQVRHIEKIERYWNLCLIAWALTYWIKQNAYLNKILETKPITVNEFKQAVNSLLELSSLSPLSKNKKLADDYFKVKSKRLKKIFAA